jgi:hypothetical protein
MKMNDNKFVGLIIGGTLLIIAGGAIAAARLKASPEIILSAEAQAAVEETSFDWGQVPINGGDVVKTFAITNEGKQPLKLYNIQTSCICTTAQLILGQKKSARFGMHQPSSAVFEVEPGQTANLEVVFDPDFHGPGGLGPISRQVSVETNDQEQSKIIFNLKGTVVR